MESNMYMMNQQQYYMPQQMMPMNGGIPMNGNQHMNGHNGMNQYANNYVHQNTYVHQNQNHVVSSPLTNKTSHKMGKIVDKAKPKGRMSSYTYFVQTCREEHRKKHPNENVNFTEFSKKCAERWKQMNDSEKQRFSEMAEHDKQRYDKEMSTYVPPPGMNGSHSKRKKKDPNAPKRPLSAFFLFCHDERPGIKALHPTYSVGEVAKDLGERWGKVTADVKAKYEAKAAQEKTRYEKDMATYKSQK